MQNLSAGEARWYSGIFEHPFIYSSSLHLLEISCHIWWMSFAVGFPNWQESGCQVGRLSLFSNSYLHHQPPHHQHPAHQPPHLDSPGHGRRPPLHTWSCPQLDASDLFSFHNFLPFTFKPSSKDFGVTCNVLRSVPALLVLTLHPISTKDLGSGSGELSVIY